MSIRICSGVYRSRRIKIPSKGVRPTSERVKEAVFSTISMYLEGANVLDLFSGSGNLGLEALSRGAREVTFVDMSKKCVETIKTNIRDLEIKNTTRTIVSDASAFVRKCRESFDIIFMDPPYNKGLARLLAPSVLRLLKEDGMLVIEHSPREALGLEPWKQAFYGDTCITYIRKEVR